MFGTTILLKQTSGIFLIIAYVVYKILMINRREDIKAFINILLARILGVLTPILLFAIYLSFNNIWTEFIDYAILGIKTFLNYVPYARLLNNSDIKIKILAYMFPIALVISVITYFTSVIGRKLRDSEFTQSLYIILVYSIASTIIIFPIADKCHFAIGSICTFLMLAYIVFTLINKLITKAIKKEKVIFGIKAFLNTISILLFIVYVFTSAKSLTKYVKNIESQNNLKHFKYIYTEETLFETINSVDKYILEKQKEGKDVIILDSIGAALNIPIDRYYKNYDMFNMGNFGANGENRNNRRFKI